MAKTGKVPLTLEGADFEFVTKVEIEKINDKFSVPALVIRSSCRRDFGEDRRIAWTSR